MIEAKVSPSVLMEIYSSAMDKLSKEARHNNRYKEAVKKFSVDESMRDAIEKNWAVANGGDQQGKV